MAKNHEEEKKAAKANVDAVSINIEPLLHYARPFFGGSDSITLAEVILTLQILPTQKLTSTNRFWLGPGSFVSTAFQGTALYQRTYSKIWESQLPDLTAGQNMLLRTQACAVFGMRSQWLRQLNGGSIK